MASSLRQAFETIGITPARAKLRLALAEFFNSGGTRMEMWDEFNQADKRMSGSGLCDVAEKAKISMPLARQPVEEGEAGLEMPHGHEACASPSSPHREPGAKQDMPFGQATTAQPARDPAKPQRAPIHFGDAALAIKNRLAQSIMDRIKIDGTAVGDYSVKRAQVEGAKRTREGFILREAARIALNIANPAPGATLRGLVKASEMERIEQAAMRLNDVA